MIVSPRSDINPENKEIFSCFSMKMSTVDTHKKELIEMLLMCIHNISFHEKKKKHRPQNLLRRSF